MSGFGDVNKQILIGRLGQDPDVRYLPTGNVVCKLSVATSHGYKVGDEWKNETTWHRVTVWNNLAEFAVKYLKKGKRVYIEGRTMHREYEKDGVKHFSTEIIASDVQALQYSANSKQITGGPEDHQTSEEEAPF